MHRECVAGELWMLRRLLDLSIEEYRAGLAPVASPKARERHEVVKRWFFGEPETPIRGWTFEAICDHLEIHPDRIRRQLAFARPSRTRRETSGNVHRGARHRRAA